jgi:ABC-2 type transport system permease protein
MSTAAKRGSISLRSRVRGPIVLAILRRDYLITRSYRLPFVLDVFFGVLNLAVYFFISRTFADKVPADLHGAPTYFAFATVGIILGLVVEAASEGIADRIREEQLTGTLESLLTYPLTLIEICFGLVSFPFVFALARIVMYLAIGSVWMNLDLTRTSWIGLATMLVATGGAVVAIGIVSGAAILVWKRGGILAAMAVFAMTILSGSFFPISVLPDGLESLGKILPLRFALDGIRASLFGSRDWSGDAIALVLFAVVGVPVAVWMFGAALQRARRAGSLAQY